MKLRTYQGESMAAALAKVKADLGRRAVILHTRSFRRGGLLGWRARTVVEITASDEGRPEEESERRVTRRASRSPRPSEDAWPCHPAREPRNSGDTTQQLCEEIETIRRMVGDVLAESRRARLPDYPADILDMYTHLVGQQVADEIARRLVEEAQAAAAREHPAGRPDAAVMRARLLDRIAGMLPPAAPLTLDLADRPKVVVLVGPTGVGKTTTIAKLAAHFKLRDGRRVGLITADTYRIAAVEQLKVYANILEIPLVVAKSPADMPAARERLADRELILIDTAGRSPRDRGRIGELKQVLDAARPDEVHLVVSSTASQPSVMQAIENFAAVSPSGLIFTKLDEAVGVGLILNVLSSVEMRVSYLTHGQSVPNDIEVAHGRRLAELILGAPGTVQTVAPAALIATA